MVALLVLPNNMDVKSKSVAKSKEGYQILIKMSVHHRDNTYKHIFTKYQKTKEQSKCQLDKGENSSTILYRGSKSLIDCFQPEQLENGNGPLKHALGNAT